MKAIKFIKNCNYNGKTYFVGDELKDVKDIQGINRLNEKGFIEPLTQKELIQIKNGSFFINKNKTEEE